jgi:hypothetical protein
LCYNNNITKQISVLSLGAGVQSTAIVLLAIEEKLPLPDFAIFADTGWEPQAVYDHLLLLEKKMIEAGIPLIRVNNGNLRKNTLVPEAYISIPIFTRNANGSQSMGRRQCTNEYKIRPIRRKIRELLGAAPPKFLRVPRGNVAEEWIGFSTDEIHRVSDNYPVKYVKKKYPLIDLGMDRKDCSEWLKLRGWEPTKSACIGCPFNGNARWRKLRDESPDEWNDAIEFDRAIRGRSSDRESFLHRSRLPLSEAPIDSLKKNVLSEQGDPDGCSPYGCRSGSKSIDK